MVDNEDASRDYVERHFGTTALERFRVFEKLLTAENERQNLVARGSLPHFWQRHIVDSLQLIRFISCETGVWLDLGSGAGFPGLAVAIVLPKIDVHLVESRRLRIEWLKRAVRELGCENCRIEGSELQALRSFPAQIISGRAFAPMPRLVQMAARFSTSQTIWVLPKGRNAAHDVQNLDPRIRQMFHVKPSITDAEAGIVVGQGKAELIA